MIKLVLLNMNAESIREYCLQKTGASESFPFGNDTLVFKVKGKIFLLLALNSSPLQFNAKSEPEYALELREMFEAIRPGYHMNKKLWNTVIIDGTLPNKLIQQLIDQSYLIVSKSLPKKFQKEI